MDLPSQSGTGAPIRNHSRNSPHPRFLILILALILSLTTVFTQFRSTGRRFIDTTQLERNRQVLEHTAPSPDRYRILSEWVAEGSIRILGRAGLSSPAEALFLFRLLQNLIIFLLAAAWWRSLKLEGTRILIGLILLSWGMSYAFRDSDLDLSLYSGVIFLLAAALAAARKLDWWIPPLAAAASLNRESAFFIPLIYLACRADCISGDKKEKSKIFSVFILSLGISAVIFFGLRRVYGWASLKHCWGNRAGLDTAVFNLTHSLTWAKLMWTVNILPLLCFFTWRNWPRRLKRIGILIIPAWIIAGFCYQWLSETRLILVPLALLFVPGALMLFYPGNEAVADGKKKRTLYLVIILGLTLVTIYTQGWVLGERYLRESQLWRHLDVIHNRACNPWQYRILSEGITFIFIKAGILVGLSNPISPFIAFRVIQNIIIFILAAIFYRRLKFSPPQIIIGLVMAGWGMSYAFYNSDLHFSTYTDIIFYLTALLLIISGRDFWILPLTFLAALNRETAVFIPLALLGARIELRGKRPFIPKNTLVVAAVAAALYWAVFLGLRLGLGWRSFTDTWGSPSIGRLWNNLQKGMGWHYFLLTVNILPLTCLLTFKSWPGILKRFFLAIIPLWLASHYYGKACLEETRFLLLPLIIGFVPGTLMLFKTTGRPQAGIARKDSAPVKQQPGRRKS